MAGVPLQADGRGTDGRGGERLVRPSGRGREARFSPDLNKRPRGMDYNWKAKTFLGMVDQFGMAEAEAFHWRSVPKNRHPELWAFCNPANETEIEVGGQVLKERPAYLSAEAKKEHTAETKYNLYQHLHAIKEASAAQIGMGKGLTEIQRTFVNPGGGAVNSEGSLIPD